MRFAVWNCLGKTAANFGHLLALAPDVGVLVEAGADLPAPSTLRAHLRNDDAFEAAGLRSAFLAARGLTVAQAYGPRSDGTSVATDEATHFHHHRRERSFHIDHVYAPTHWMRTPPKVRVGSYDEWVAARRSDHVPVVVDFRRLSQAAGT